MKVLPIVCLVSFAALTACKKREELPTPVMKEEKEQKEPPGKERAAIAAAKVRQEMEGDLSAAGLVFGDPVFICAFKEEKQLDFFVRNRKTKKFDLFRTYRIAGASGIPGPKLAEGDLQVPEGFYSVPPAAMNPDSQLHLAFNIGFPNKYDLAHQRTGSFIMIHGSCNSIGCLAMTDEKIDEIYTLCDAAHQGGQTFFRVHMFPFRMTSERMAKATGDANEEFWKNLKEGYDLFEKNHVPPEVSVVDGRYVFK